MNLAVPGVNMVNSLKLEEPSSRDLFLELKDSGQAPRICSRVRLLCNVAKWKGQVDIP